MRRPGLRSLTAVAAIAVLATPPHTAHAESPWSACYAVLRAAADRYGVPFRILEAVAQTESGREGNGYLWPWPWTVNVAGSSRFYNTAAEAAARIEAVVAAGNKNVDVGCMQLNWRYHGAAFASAAAALDPRANVEYAAQLLAAEHAAGGTWSEAVSRYHTRNPSLAAEYRCRIVARLRPQSLPAECRDGQPAAK